MIAVVDTGPLLYIGLIGRSELLPLLFEKVLVPRAVAEELSHASTPEQVRNLIANCPRWLEIRSVRDVDASLSRFGRGEQEAIALAVSVAADVLLIDDGRAKRFATQTAGIAASGTIGVLYEAAFNDHVAFSVADFDEAAATLLGTSFYASARLRTSLKMLSGSLHEQEKQRRAQPP